MNNFKFKILEKIESVSNVFYKSGLNEYRIRCPFCGDSQNNLKDAHLYIKCSLNLNEPMIYHCFKCNKSGKVNKYFLNKLNIDLDLQDPSISNRLTYINQSPTKIENTITHKDYFINRLGDGLTDKDYLKFRIVSIDSVKELINKRRFIIPNDSDAIAFMTEDNSLLILRNIYNIGFRWKKIPIYEGVSVYTIKTQIELFSKDDININISEGIFDSIGLYKHLGQDKNVFISVLSSNYKLGIDYAINKGFVGNNINIRIYLDSDINEQGLKYLIKKYKWIFKSIKFYKNILDHDYGVKNIQLMEV